MKVLAIIPASSKAKNVHRDVLYGCWCKGNRIGGGSLPPLSLLSVATVLKNDGNEVVLADMIEEGLKAAEVSKLAKDADIALVLTSSMSFQEDAALLAGLKESSYGRLSTVVFGSHPTFMPEECLEQPGIDFVARKEPEFIIRDLVRALRKGGGSPEYSGIPGIGYKQDAKAFINQDYPSIDNAELLPIPDRSLLPKNARYFNPAVRSYPYTTALTSRGCPGRCSFCVAPRMMGNKLRFWSPARTIEEIEYLLGLGYREVYYRDETFTTFKRRNREIFQEIIRRKLKFSWICNIRADTVDREDLVLMKRAGCRMIKVGVESGSEEILRKSKKQITLEQVRDVFRWSNQLKLDTHAHLMFGMPGESRRSLDKTLKFIREIKPTTIDVGICTPYPGTELFDSLVVSSDPGQDLGRHVDLANLHIKAKYNEVFTEVDNRTIEWYISKVYRQFYLNPFYILKWLGKVRSPADLLNIARAGINVISFALNKEKELENDEDSIG